MRYKLLRGPGEIHFNRVRASLVIEASLDALPSLQFVILCIGGIESERDRAREKKSADDRSSLRR